MLTEHWIRLLPYELRKLHTGEEISKPQKYYIDKDYSRPRLPHIKRDRKSSWRYFNAPNRFTTTQMAEAWQVTRQAALTQIVTWVKAGTVVVKYDGKVRIYEKVEIVATDVK